MIFVISFLTFLFPTSDMISLNMLLQILYAVKQDLSSAGPESHRQATIKKDLVKIYLEF